MTGSRSAARVRPRSSPWPSGAYSARVLPRPRRGSPGSSSTRSGRPPTTASPSARAGTYERITGRVFGELDPRDRRNAVITDLDLAPRNARGMVEYVATFTLWQPTDPAKASGVLIYAVPNRGNRLFFPAFHLGGEPGDGFFFRRGDAILASGWQGDVVAAGRRDDHRPGGEERATGPASPARCSHVSVDMPAGTQTLAAPLGERAGRPRHRAGDPHPPGLRGRRRHPDRPRRLGVRRLPHGPVPRHARPDPPLA